MDIIEVNNPNRDIFYLGFNKNTGVLVDVVPPPDRQIRLHPRQIHKLNLGLLEEKEERDVLAQLRKFNDLIKECALPPITITFVDQTDQSPCGASVGGICFSLCK